MSRLIAIGDIHGCLVALNALLDAVAPQPDDEIVVLGDFIDRGPDSRGVIDRLITLNRECQLTSLLGNHEEMMLAALDNPSAAGSWLPHGGLQTLTSYNFVGDLSVISNEHRDWLGGCLPFHESSDFFFVHANYEPVTPLEEQPAELLRWTDLHQHEPGPHRSGKTAVVGHTAQASGDILDLGHLRCLDTCCYGGGWLTAMDLTSGHVWQSNEAGKLRS